MQPQAKSPSAAPPGTHTTSEVTAGKYLIFEVAGEEFGVAILKVREIIKIQDITFVPHMPACVKGVINLRGKVIPVVDLRLKFEMEAAPYNSRTCIVVISLETPATVVLTGVVVDSVSEVLNIAANDVEAAPDFADESRAGYLLGMAKIKGKVKILLDIERVLQSHSSAALLQ